MVQKEDKEAKMVTGILLSFQLLLSLQLNAFGYPFIHVENSSWKATG